MLTFEEALEKAKALKKGIDACEEYDIAYLFKRKADRFNIGGDGACIILKDNGRAINQTEFYECYDANSVREFDIE